MNDQQKLAISTINSKLAGPILCPPCHHQKWTLSNELHMVPSLRLAEQFG